MKLSLSLSMLAFCISLVGGQAFAADKPAAPSSTDMKIFIDKIKADKKLLISQNMGLTEEQAKIFWPLYEAYQADLAPINQRLTKAVTSYAEAYNKGAIPDDVATKLINESIAIDQAEAQVRKANADKILKALPASKAARYLQIENKLRAVVRFELASQIPLVE
jgi:hypothetical protein